MKQESISQSRKAIHRALLGLEGLVAIIFVMVVIVTAAGQVDTSKSVDDLSEAAFGAMKAPQNMRKGEDWEAAGAYGTFPEYEGLCFYLPKTNMDAEELCLIKCRDEAGAAAAAEVLAERLEAQKALFENYGRDQMALLNAARVICRGPYAILVVDENAADVAAAIKQAT